MGPRCTIIPGFSDRLYYLVYQYSGLSMADFCRLTGVDKKCIYGTLQGASTLSPIFIYKICKALQVDANWLLLGQGEPPRNAR